MERETSRPFEVDIHSLGIGRYEGLAAPGLLADLRGEATRLTAALAGRVFWHELPHAQLLDDPRDLEAFAGLVDRLVANRALRERPGSAARAQVSERFLEPRSVMDHLRLAESLLESVS